MSEPEPDPESDEEEEDQPPVFKRRRLRFLVANPNKKSRGPAPAEPPVLPNYFTILLKEAEQNDLIHDWGRCCIAGTASNNDSPLMLTKTRCHLDLRTVQNLTLTLLDHQHLTLVKASQDSLVKIELLVYM